MRFFLFALLLGCSPQVAVQMTAPRADLTTRGPVTFQFLVEGASTIDVTLDGERFARLDAPFSLSLDTNTLTEGAHEVFASAGSSTSEVRHLTIDRTPPRIVRRAPLSVQAPALTTALEVEFDEPLAPASVRPDAAKLVGPTGPIDATSTLSADQRTIRFVLSASRPEVPLPVKVSIGGVTDLAGNVALDDGWTIAFEPYRRIPLPADRFPSKLIVDSKGAPWVLSSTSAFTLTLETLRAGAWSDGRMGLPAALDVTDLRATPEGRLELAGLTGQAPNRSLVVFTRGADDSSWQQELTTPSTATVALLATAMNRSILLSTAAGWQLATFRTGNTPTLSAPLALPSRPRLVSGVNGPVTIVSEVQDALLLLQDLGGTWQAARLQPAVLRPQVFFGRDERTFRVIGLAPATQRLEAFEVLAQFGDLNTPGTAARLRAWAADSASGETVETIDFPALSRDWLDTGDLGGRGFVVTRSSSLVSVWPYGWETNREALFADRAPVTTLSLGLYSGLISDSRWFGSVGTPTHRHGVIVQRFEDVRLVSELYLPND